MRCAIPIVLIALFAAAGDSPAHADPYRWCGVYGGGDGSVATNCYFLTLQQCRAAISGNGGFCTPNTFYDGRPVGAPDEGQPIRRVHPLR